MRAIYDGADMSKGEAVRGLVAATVERLGRVDILVNNAGIQFTAPVEEFPAEKWDAILAINLSAAFHGIAAAVPQMKKQGWGRIVNIASAHGLVGSTHKAAYVAAKHGLVGLTKVVGLETAGTGITANAVCPGWVRTPLVEKQIADIAAEKKISQEDARMALLGEKQPSRTFVTPEQLGGTVAFLCSASGRSDHRHRHRGRRCMDGTVGRRSSWRRLNMKKTIGLVLCLGAVVAVTAGWAWVRSSGEASTDNAYIRGDMTSLAPKVAGYVTAVEVEDNQTVRAGDVLFRIDDRDYRARLAQAVADVEAAQARLTNVDAETQLQHALIRQAEAQRRSAMAELKLARTAADRRHKLIRSNAVGQEQVDEGDATRSSADADVSAASATLEAQQQRIAVLATERETAVAPWRTHKPRAISPRSISRHRGRAPVDGVIGNRQVRIGRLVAPGTSLLDIVPVDDVWIVANFKETQLEHIRPGQRVRITIDGYPNEALEGVVDSFAPGSGSAFSLLPADNATGNFVRVVQRVPVKIRFASNPLPGRLVPGLSARVEIDLGSGS